MLRIFVSVVTLVSLGSVVLAQTNPINGDFGAHGGCAISRDPNTAAGSDLMLLLQPTYLQTYFMDCPIQQIALTEGGGAVLSLACGTEENGTIQIDATISPLAGQDGFLFRFGPNDQGTELLRC